MRVLNNASVFGAESEQNCELTIKRGRPTLDTMDPLGSRIRARREELQLTARQVAERAGVDPATISLVERGRMPNVSFVNLSRIARALGISLDDLADPQLAATA